MPTQPQTAIPWYKSKIITGAAVGVISKLLIVSGIMPQLVGEHSADIANLIVGAAGLLGDGVAIASRAKQVNAPVIVASKASADLVASAGWLDAQAAEDAAANQRTDDALPPFAFPFLGQADALSKEQQA